MSYGGELTFTLRHSPVTRLPTNDRNNRKGGAFVQMKVNTKCYYYYRMKLISLIDTTKKIQGSILTMFLRNSIVNHIQYLSQWYRTKTRLDICYIMPQIFLILDIMTKRKKHSFYFRILHSFLLLYLWDNLL